MKVAPSQFNPFGVIVLRVQVAKLHEGHKHLISQVSQLHRDVLIVIGVQNDGVRARRNELTFKERKYMVREMVRNEFPNNNFIIRSLLDSPISYAEWSQRLDLLIKETFSNSPAVLYGSRDSFIPMYLFVRFPTF